MLRFVEANISPEGLPASMRRAVQATHLGYFNVADMVQGLGWEQYSYPVTLDQLLAGNSNTIAMQPNPVTLVAGVPRPARGCSTRPVPPTGSAPMPRSYPTNGSAL